MYNDYIIDQVPDKLFTCYFNIHEILLQSAILFSDSTAVQKGFNSYCKEVRNIYKWRQPTGGGGLSKVDVTQLSNLKVIRISINENWKVHWKNKYESPNRRINYSFYIFILLILLQKQNLNVRKVYTDMMFKVTFANVLYLIQILYWDIVVFFSWLNIS